MEEEEVELMDNIMAGPVKGWVAAQGVVATKHSWDVGFLYCSRQMLGLASVESRCSSEPDRITKFHKKYRSIHDDYNSLKQVTQALVDSGLESSKLIVANDFTKSNEWTRKKSFNGKSLHAISIIGRTLSAFDEDNLIPCFGFGDVTTHDRDVFKFYPDHRPCYGFEEALNRYREPVGDIKLADIFHA